MCPTCADTLVWKCFQTRVRAPLFGMTGETCFDDLTLTFPANTTSLSPISLIHVHICTHTHLLTLERTLRSVHHRPCVVARVSPRQKVSKPTRPDMTSARPCAPNQHHTRSPNMRKAATNMLPPSKVSRVGARATHTAVVTWPICADIAAKVFSRKSHHARLCGRTGTTVFFDTDTHTQTCIDT